MKRTSLTIMIMSVILASVLTGCMKTSSVPVTIGVNSWPPCEVWYIAEEQGYFEDVPVEIVRFKTWSDNMNSLYIGNVDITHSTYFNSIYFSDKGEAGQMIAPIDFVEGSDGLVVKSGMALPEDLKGKRIAVEIGTDEHYLLFKVLEYYGIELDEVEFVSVPSYQAHEMFINDEVDAVFTYDPFLTMAAEKGQGKVVFTTADLPGHMVDALVGRQAAIKERPKDFKIIMKAWYKAIQYIQEHPDEAYALMSAKEEMSKDDFQAFYESFTFFDSEQALEIMKSGTFKQTFEDIEAFSLHNKLIKEEIQWNDTINSSILEGLKKEGLQ